MRNHIHKILTGIGLYTFIPFLVLTCYIQPTADDFDFAIRDTSLSFFKAQVIYYFNWSGRYFGTAIVRANPLALGLFEAYKLYATVLLVLLAGSVYTIVYTITKRLWNKMHVLAFAATLLALYLLNIPSPTEGFYFFSTYATYQLPNIMLLIMLVLVYRFFDADRKTVKIIYIGAASILCFAVIGSNEMSVVITFTSVFFIAAHNLKNTEARPYLLFLFFICVVACMVAVFAPGNYNRMSEHENASRFVWSTVYSAFLTSLTFYRWLAPVLSVSILYILYFSLPHKNQFKQLRLFNVDLRLAILYYLATLFLMYFVFAWSTGERATPRVENVICFFFLFGWFYVLQVAVNRYSHLLKAEELLSPVIPAIALLLFLLQILSVENNISTSYVDLLSGKAAAFDEALQKRYALLSASEKDTHVVSPLPAVPKSIFFADILPGKENIGHDLNKGFAEFWDKRAIYLRSPNPEIKDNLTTLREFGKSKL